MAPNLISIIIPIYNVSDYLKTCLNSVQKQTYPQLEIILVNDGSTDDSVEIAKEFVDNDERSKIIHQSNQGLSEARNTGLKAAKGDYIFYLDSDDFIIKNAIEILICAAKNHHADIVQGNFYYDYPDYLLLNKQQKEETAVYNRQEAMFALLEHKTVLNFAWGKLIKSSLAKKHIFPKGKFFEDTFWKYKLIHNSKTYVALKTPILYYLQRGSAISGAFSIRNLDLLEGETQRLKFLKKHYPPKYERQALKLLNKKVIRHRKNLHQLSPEEAKIYAERLKDIENKYRLKQLFPKSHQPVYKRLDRLKSGIKNRLIKNPNWQKIEK